MYIIYIYKILKGSIWMINMIYNYYLKKFFLNKHYMLMMFININNIYIKMMFNIVYILK